MHDPESQASQAKEYHKFVNNSAEPRIRVKAIGTLLIAAIIGPGMYGCAGEGSTTPPTGSNSTANTTSTNPVSTANAVPITVTALRQRGVMVSDPRSVGEEWMVANVTAPGSVRIELTQLGLDSVPMKATASWAP